VLEPLEQQQGDQGGPQLDAQRVLVGADEGLDLELLLEGLEEQFDLPAIAVDGGDGGGAEVEVVGQQHQLAVVGLVPDDDAPERVGALLARLGPGQADVFVGADGAVGRQRLVVDDPIVGVALEAGDEEDAGRGPVAEQLVVVVRPATCSGASCAARCSTRLPAVPSTPWWPRSCGARPTPPRRPDGQAPTDPVATAGAGPSARARQLAQPDRDLLRGAPTQRPDPRRLPYSRGPGGPRHPLPGALPAGAQPFAWYFTRDDLRHLLARCEQHRARAA